MLIHVLISHGVLRETGLREWCVIGTESLLTTNGTQGVERIGCCTENALKRGDGAVEYNVAFSFSSFFKICREDPRADVNRNRWIQSPEC